MCLVCLSKSTVSWHPGMVHIRKYRAAFWFTYVRMYVCMVGAFIVVCMVPVAYLNYPCLRKTESSSKLLNWNRAFMGCLGPEWRPVLYRVPCLRPSPLCCVLAQEFPSSCDVELDVTSHVIGITASWERFGETTDPLWRVKQVISIFFCHFLSYQRSNMNWLWVHTDIKICRGHYPKGKVVHFYNRAQYLKAIYSYFQALCVHCCVCSVIPPPQSKARILRQTGKGGV